MKGMHLSENYVIVKHPIIMLSAVFVYMFISSTSFMIGDYYQKLVRIKEIIMFHNIVSICLSLYMFVGIAIHTKTHNYTWMGNELDQSDTTLANYLWIFHLTKYYECMDTFIMIFRKSFRQITFLHVYHHATMIVFTWMVLYNHPGGDFYLGPMLNSFVHVWMYIYYLCASFLDKKRKVKYLWWSKYLTQLQIIQFFINLYHSIYTLKNNENDRLIFQIGLFHQLSFILFFGNFYLNKYKKLN